MQNWGIALSLIAVRSDETRAHACSLLAKDAVMKSYLQYSCLTFQYVCSDAKAQAILRLFTLQRNGIKAKYFLA